MKVEVKEIPVSEAEILLDKALREKDTKSLVKKLNFDLNQIKIKAYEIRLFYTNQEDKLIETLMIYHNNETVIEATKDYDDNNFKKIIAHYVDTTRDSKKIMRISVKNNQIHVLMELPYNHNYFDFFAKTEESNISIQQNWYDGCLTFSDPVTGRHYYRHCGANCGDNGATGGGTPINALDTCCRSHDRCYANFGYNDCGCDRQLGDCANRTTDPGWYFVSSWAYNKSCN